MFSIVVVLPVEISRELTVAAGSVVTFYLFLVGVVHASIYQSFNYICEYTARLHGVVIFPSHTRTER